MKTPFDKEVSRFEMNTKENIQTSPNKGLSIEQTILEEDEIYLLVTELRKLSLQKNREPAKPEDNRPSLVDSTGVTYNTADIEVAFSSVKAEEIINTDKHSPDSFWRKIFMSPLSLFRKIKDSFYDLE